MAVSQNACLALAHGALSRRDYLSTLQLAKRVADTAKSEIQQYDAYILLALASLELGIPEDALTYAVGAHLLAHRFQDSVREERAIGVVELVVAKHPSLRDPESSGTVH